MSQTKVPSLLFVGVGATYTSHESTLKPLQRAERDIRRLCEVLASRSKNFASIVSIDAGRAELVEAFEQDLPKAGSPGCPDVLVCLWIGHAQPYAGGQLQLFLNDNDADAAFDASYSADQFAARALSTGASQVLFIIDTCFSGSAVAPVTQIASELTDGISDQSGRWFGVVASCQPFQLARDDSVSARLADLIEQGPRSPARRLLWSMSEGLRGDVLVDTLLKEWDQIPEFQFPRPLLLGDPRSLFPNPLHSRSRSDSIPEQMLLAAQGRDQTETGNFFSGRGESIQQLVSAIAQAKPGLHLVTGPPGTGKSAIVGRLASLSNRGERRAIEAANGLPDAARDPGEGSVAAHLELRGLSLDAAALHLADSLGVVTPHPSATVSSILNWASWQDSAPLIIVDGLDEAGDDAVPIADNLLVPLAGWANLIVATRDRSYPNGRRSLVECLGRPATTIDLAAAPQTSSASDLATYARRRLEALGTTTDVEELAAQVVALVSDPTTGGTGSFLLARLITSQLRAEAPKIADRHLPSLLSRTLEEAVTRDVDRSAAKSDSTRFLLASLATAHGRGYPERIWRIVATGLSPTPAHYSGHEIIDLIDDCGRQIILDSDEDGIVYRLAHDRLVDVHRSWIENTNHHSHPDQRVAECLLQSLEKAIAAGDDMTNIAYLKAHLWRHTVDGGSTNCRRLETLALASPPLMAAAAAAWQDLGLRQATKGQYRSAADSTERAVHLCRQAPDDDAQADDRLAAALNILGAHYAKLGLHDNALDQTQQSVVIRRQLADHNPRYRDALAATLNNLGIRYNALGRYHDAIEVADQAVSIRAQPGQTAPYSNRDLATALENLAGHHSSVGQFDTARKAAERAVELRRISAQLDRNERPAVGRALLKLSDHYASLGRYRDALVSARKAVVVLQSSAEPVGAAEPDLGQALHKLATQFHLLGSTERALRVAERAIIVLRSAPELDPTNRELLADTYMHLSNYRAAVGQLDASLQAADQSVKLRGDPVAADPETSAATAMSLTTLGKRLGASGQRDLAIAQCRKALAIIGESHHGIVALEQAAIGAFDVLGEQFAALARWREAADAWEAAAARSTSLAVASPKTRIGLMTRLSTAYAREGLPALAEQAAREALTSPHSRESTGEDGPLMATAWQQLARALTAQQRYRESIDAARTAVEVLRQVSSQTDTSLNLASALADLGATQLSGMDYGAATSTLLEVIDLCNGIARHGLKIGAIKASACHDLARIYIATGRINEAAQLLHESVALRTAYTEAVPAAALDLGASLNLLPDSGGLWRDTLQYFAESPSILAQLLIWRSRIAPDLPTRLRYLIEALQASPALQPEIVSAIRREIRAARDSNPTEFRRLAKGHELSEDWVWIETGLLRAAERWIETKPWRQSKIYLQGQGRALLSPDGDLVLTELGLTRPGDRRVGEHQLLLRRCSSIGVAAGYQPLLVEDTIATWYRTEDLVSAKKLIASNRNHFHHPAAISAVIEQGGGYRLPFLELIQHDAVDLAFDLMSQSEGLDLQLDALRSSAPPRIAEAGSRLVAMITRDRELAAKAITNRAIARVRNGDLDYAYDLVGAASKLGTEPASMIDDVRDAVNLSVANSWDCYGDMLALLVHILRRDQLS